MTAADPELAHLLRAGVVHGHADAPPWTVSVELDDDGRVTEITPSPRGTLVLSQSLVDVHSDVVERRRRPRPGVEVPVHLALHSLDAELAAAGVGIVCACVRFEAIPELGVQIDDAVEFCAAIEELVPTLACEWRVHARVEMTAADGPDALQAALARTGRIAIVSLVDHSPERSRFSTPADRLAFYARDWHVDTETVAAVLARRGMGRAGANGRRKAVADAARKHGLPLASHDDRDAADVRAAFALGARICEFPLGLDAAGAAQELGMGVVLGATGALLGRSTSPAGFTAAKALAAGACDALCSDYLPASVLHAPLALAERGLPLARALATVTSTPRRMLRLPPVTIAVGEPLSAALLDPRPGRARAVALWRDGRIVHRSATRDI